MYRSLICLMVIPLLSIAEVRTEPNAPAISDHRLCGLSPEQTYTLLRINRGPVNGGYDIDGNGVTSTEETFTKWDFNQIHDTLEYGVEYQSYSWTNIDTCYTFVAIPLTFVEDNRNDPIWRTCRNFKFAVQDRYGRIVSVGTNVGYACRNFATHVWKIIGG